MNKVLFILLFVSQIIWAQSPFEQGNDYYQKENYQAAIQSFESILESGKESAEVYFNLGNAYYKLHKVAPAIYNYEKALLLHPNDEEIKTNLDFARKMTIDDIKVIPKVGFQKLLSDLTSKYHYDTWAWFAVAFAFLFLAFFAGYYFSQKTILKRVFFLGMFIWLLGIGLAAASGFYERSRMEHEKPAIIFAESTALKNEPKVNSPDATALHEGTKVYILESIANWKKVELTDETTGWIEDSAIKEIK
ncbi:tetratricopeptide repeat protein [Flavobacterium sp. J49]|uniref:tetratricopeptide repeat protein n=1 Tax=Flavobacterium sp. J49 TaxID=2718534 RepID=UPI00159318F0|nr:tetratricopeptide repeat protein [Flavobacterium sp. J49]MBF6641385.1 tetratricopeptide repeat protein [Flavobacterium sp. J49]NIC02632.1 tetratricopeptide repeat protein [Flavobacterium sp. J49]